LAGDVEGGGGQKGRAARNEDKFRAHVISFAPVLWTVFWIVNFAHRTASVMARSFENAQRDLLFCGESYVKHSAVALIIWRKYCNAGPESSHLSMTAQPGWQDGIDLRTKMGFIMAIVCNQI
jgi:hypothetical protein